VVRVEVHLKRYDQVSGGQSGGLISHKEITLGTEKEPCPRQSGHGRETHDIRILPNLATSLGRIYSKEYSLG
jgi:hypothetical protein